MKRLAVGYELSAVGDCRLQVTGYLLRVKCSYPTPSTLPPTPFTETISAMRHSAAGQDIPSLAFRDRKNLRFASSLTLAML